MIKIVWVLSYGMILVVEVKVKFGINIVFLGFRCYVIRGRVSVLVLFV